MLFTRSGESTDTIKRSDAALPPKWIQESGKQERGESRLRELDLNPTTRGQGCPRSKPESALSRRAAAVRPRSKAAVGQFADRGLGPAVASPRPAHAPLHTIGHNPRCGAALDCGDRSPLFLRRRHGESGSEFKRSRDQPAAKQKRRRAAAVQGVLGKSQSRLDVL